MSYQFQNVLFRTEDEMFNAIAGEWLCACGLNGKETVLELLDEFSDRELAEECTTAWFDNEIEVGDLETAFATLRENPDYYFGWDE